MEHITVIEPCGYALTPECKSSLICRVFAITPCFHFKFFFSFIKIIRNRNNSKFVLQARIFCLFNLFNNHAFYAAKFHNSLSFEPCYLIKNFFSAIDFGSPLRRPSSRSHRVCQVNCVKSFSFSERPHQQREKIIK